MTLDKSACRRMLEEYFEDYGPYHRFELHMTDDGILFMAQKAKQRIPHPEQAILGEG